jgi:hypothetical protein
MLLRAVTLPRALPFASRIFTVLILGTIALDQLGSADGFGTYPLYVRFESLQIRKILRRWRNYRLS